MGEIDFYYLGQQKAKETFEVLQDLAVQYEKQYGQKARDEFELGVASVISQYAMIQPAPEIKEEDLEQLKAAKEQSVSNLRNNSYFGGVGTSKQFVDYNGHKVYNDPKEGPHK